MPKWDYEPTGRLRLHLDPAAVDGARKRWSAGRRAKLEDLLNDFVVGLAVVADGKRARTLYWQRRREEEEARERQRLQAEKHRREEAERGQALERQAESWAKAQQLRAFIDEVERRTNAKGTPLAPDGELGQWIAWARRHAGRLALRTARGTHGSGSSLSRQRRRHSLWMRTDTSGKVAA